MPPELIILSLVVITALVFDFTNGFHDTANAMATSIATGAFKPKAAVTLSAILNLVGAFLSVEVALTVTNSVVNIQDASGAPRPELLQEGGQALLLIVLAGLVGAIVWNLVTWLFGLPSSSSHALFGGLIGATMAGLGTGGVNWIGDGTKPDGVIGKVVLPALMSPFIAIIIATVGTWLVHRITKHVLAKYRNTGFRWGQIGSASLVALAHGTNDAQKTMGVITLALIASGQWTDLQAVPLWVKVACAMAITLGTYTGGWRIIRTMGKGLTELTPPQGMAAEFSTASVILVSSHMGFALSTTHVATGSILGAGVGKKGAKVNWRVAGKMVAAWCITLPCSGVMGAVMWFIGHSIGGVFGALVITAILVVCAGAMYRHSLNTKIDHNNVNAEWAGGENGASIHPAPASTDAVEQPVIAESLNPIEESMKALPQADGGDFADQPANDPKSDLELVKVN